MKMKELLEMVMDTSYSKYLKTKTFVTAYSEKTADMVAEILNKNLSEEEMNQEIDKLREKLGKPKR